MAEQMEETTGAGIPRSLAPFFQEYSLDVLDPAEHADLIIERTLAYGNRAEIRWLFGRYGKERIVAWIEQSGTERLPHRRYNLWCVVFDLKRRERRGLWRY
jgi:hypothetical protein